MQYKKVFNKQKDKWLFAILCGTRPKRVGETLVMGIEEEVTAALYRQRSYSFWSSMLQFPTYPLLFGKDSTKNCVGPEVGRIESDLENFFF